MDNSKRPFSSDALMRIQPFGRLYLMALPNRLCSTCRSKVISNNESTKTEMNCPRESQTPSSQITLPSWSLAFLLGAPSTSLAFGWDVLYWILPYRPWPGFRHPCRNDGFSGLAGLVYNGKSPSLALPEGTPSPSLARIFAEELFVIFMHNSFRCWWIHYWKYPKVAITLGQGCEPFPRSRLRCAGMR